MDRELDKEIISSLTGIETLSTKKLCNGLNVGIFSLLKEVRLMRKKGYEIKGNPFYIKKTNTKLSKLKIMWYAKRYRGIAVFDVLSSTNDYLKANNDLKEGSVVIADGQIRGRGRNTNSFLSPKGKGIYLSYLLKPDIQGENLVSLTPKLALCVLKILKEFSQGVGIKWVNDIVYSGKKLCGILTEIKGYGNSDNYTYAVLGIGINVNSKSDDFTEGVREIATSLSQIIGIDIDRNKLIGSLIRELDSIMSTPYCNEADRELYNDNLVIKGKEICFSKEGKDYQGICRGIDDSFRLIVRLKDGEEMFLDSGEVSVRGMFGYTSE